MAGELRRAAPFRDPVEHKSPSLPEVLDSYPEHKKGPSETKFSLGAAA
jgi:hypothetical protein